MRYLMSKFTSARYVGRHRGTPGRLMLQEAQTAERWSAWVEWMTTPGAEKAEV